MAGSMATRSPRRGPSAINPAPSCPSTSGCASVASPIAPSSHQCRSEPQIPTAVTRTRLIPAAAAGAGSSPTRRSPIPCSRAARTPSPPPGLSSFFIPNGPWCAPPGPRKPVIPVAGRRGSPVRGLLRGGAADQVQGAGVGLAGGVRPADRDRVAGVVLDQGVRDVLGRGDRLAADGGDRVARGQAGLGGGGAG